MPTLSAALQAALSGPITKPVFFYELGYSTTLNWCSRSTTNWNGITWVGIGISQGEISPMDDGTVRSAFSVVSPDATVSTLVLSEGANGQTVKIWVSDAEALAAGDPVLFFDGVIDGATIDGDSVVTFQVASRADGKTFTPRQIISAPVFNHVPAPGTQINWGSEVYVIGE